MVGAAAALQSVFFVNSRTYPSAGTAGGHAVTGGSYEAIQRQRHNSVTPIGVAA